LPTWDKLSQAAVALLRLKLGSRLAVLSMIACAAILLPATPARVVAQVTAGATLSLLAPLVEVARGGEGVFVSGSDGQVVQPGDQVRTGPVGVGLLTFFDGSETQVTPDTQVQLEQTTTAPTTIGALMVIGTVVNRVLPAAVGAGFQTNTPSATALVRGTTYVVTVGHLPPSPPNTPPVPCAPTEVTTCVTSVILLADPDGRVGLVGVVSHGTAPTIELTAACEVAAVAARSARSVLDPQTCADLQQSVLNLSDPAAAILTAQIGDRVNRSVAPSVSGPAPPGGGGGGAPGGNAGLPGGGAGGAAGNGPGPFATAAGPALFGVNAGYRDPQVMTDLGATWDRIIVSWAAVQPNGPNDFTNMALALPNAQIDAESSRGIRLVGLLQFTPQWAAAHPEFAQRSAPTNLDLPFDDPANYWGRFVSQVARTYAGRIDDWIVWNEPEFKPGEPGAGGSYTWLGTDEEFAQLLKVAYLAIKKANPSATVSFPGTSYWVDQNAHRPQFYERLLAILDRDPAARAAHWYHDVVSLNLYRNADDMVRVHSVYTEIQKRFGINVPIWLSETNAMPSDDLQLAPCDHRADGIPTTMDQQAAFAVQAFALAAVAGYQRAAFYQMIDDKPCEQPAVWGAVRDDGSRRPVADALRTAFHTFGGFIQARFVPVERAESSWAIWPDDAASYWPNWQVYDVVFDMPGARRISVLWNADGAQLCVRVRKNSTSAVGIDKLGQPVAIVDAPGSWQLNLPPATAHFAEDPDGYYFIGGTPLLLTEENVQPDAPVQPAQVGCDQTQAQSPLSVP
jgi:hypothetical protein